MKKAIKTDKAPGAIGPYSQAIIANGFVFCSGQIAIDPATGKVVEGDVAQQTEQVMRNLAALLKEAHSSFAQTVKATVYLKNMSDFAVVNVIYGKHVMSDAPPARATVAVAGLPRDVLVEIDLIATVDAS